MSSNETTQLDQIPFSGYKNAFEYMQTLAYTDNDNITFLEQQLYTLLQSEPENANLLSLLMHEQIMHNRGARARSIAQKIWEIGGALDADIEQMYIDDLMNLGLEDMVATALSPYIADFEKSVTTHSFLLLKYAIFSGNMSLLERVVSYLSENEESNILKEWIQLSEELNANNHIPQIMKQLINNVRNEMLGFSYNLFKDRDIPDIEFVFYVEDSVKNYDDLREKMHFQISAYCAAHKIQDLVNLSVVIYPLSRHPKQELWLPKI